MNEIIRKSKDYVYGIWVYKALGIWKGYYRVKKSLVSYMKPWTEARNNKYMKYHSKLTYQLSFWNVSRKVDYHAGGKWFIHGPKRRKENYVKIESLNNMPSIWENVLIVSWHAQRLPEIAVRWGARVRCLTVKATTLETFIITRHNFALTSYLTCQCKNHMGIGKFELTYIKYEKTLHDGE